MFERYEKGERAVVVFTSNTSSDGDMGEFLELVASTGVTVAYKVKSLNHKPQAKYYLGIGKADELSKVVLAYDAQVVIVNHDLSPSQERNLESLLSCRVLSRSGLILDIFAQRARTFEGKLQVELAQLQHLQTRLVRGWTHLERQKGGIGLRGPGETQLETDRRLIRARIKSISARLEKVRGQRAENRRARKKSRLPVVSLVGYTNAGKSTLFNTLTQSLSMAEDKLFATLDPLMRKVKLPSGGEMILADTVGFIRDLPHDLVASFKATLEETRDADLLLHIIDVSSTKFREHMAVVSQVLKDIGADKLPIVQVFNKIDRMEQAAPTFNEGDEKDSIWVSAQNGDGVELLLEVVNKRLFGELKVYELVLTPDKAKIRAEFYQRDAVVSESIDEEGNWHLSIRLSASDFDKLRL